MVTLQQSVEFHHTTVCTCRLEEDGVLTDCSIKTQEAEEMLDFNFSSTNVVNKVILKVDTFTGFDQV